MYKLSMRMFNDKHIVSYDTPKKYNYTYDELFELLNEENKKIEIDRKLELSELQGKVYAYEKIIANSNFKTILEEPKTNKKKEGEDNESN